jgi:hypothetical protein
MMRRVLLLLASGGLVVLLCGAGSLLSQHARNDLLPPGATDVRFASRNLSQLHITYHIPPDWILLSLYDELEDHGWTRDQAAEERLRSGGAAESMFAIFTRQNWFGLAHEVAVVGIAPYKHARVQIRQVRCLTIGSAAGCQGTRT